MRRLTSSIKLTLEQEMIFVTPRSKALEVPITEDPMLRGVVLLDLPRARKVKSVDIKLEILCDAYGGEDYQYESAKLMEKSLHLDVNDHLEAGEHIFNFSFIIPSSTPVTQRSSHGRVRHFVRATAHFGPAIKTSCNPVAFFVCAVTSPADEPPEPLVASLQHHSEDLGPINIQLASPHVTISSLLHVSICFLSSPKPVTILVISGQISQRFAVHYNDKKVALPPPRRHVMAKVDATARPTPLRPTISRPANVPGVHGLISSPPPPDPVREDPRPLHALQKEEEYSYSTLLRIPTDDLVRPSTLPGTETRIRVTHSIVLEIRYRKEGEVEDRLLLISRPLVIASCCCLASQSTLPPYSAMCPVRNSSDPAPAPLHLVPIRINCLCNTSLSEMLDSDGQVLERVSTIVADSPHYVHARQTLAEEQEERRRAELEYERRIREDKSAPVHTVGHEGRL